MVIKSLLPLTILAIAVTSGTAAGQGITLKEGGVVITDISGHPGKIVGAGAADDRTDAGISKVSIFEKKDKPCELHVELRELYDAQAYNPPISGSLCTPGSDHVVVSFSENPRYYLRGVAACTNDKKDTSKRRLKGIKIYPAKVKRDGTVTNLSTNEGDEQAHCKIWHPAVYCPGGFIASKVRAHYKDDYFTGLSLRCREVVIE